MLNPNLNIILEPQSNQKSSLTYAQATQNGHDLSNNTQHNNLSNSLSTQITLINDLKSIITPLISQYSTVINKIFVKNHD